MKKITTLVLAILLSILTLSVPARALEKLPKGASLGEAYNRVLYFQKKLESVPQEEIDSLRGTIDSYLNCDVVTEYAYSSGRVAEELINEAKAKRGNVDAQIWCVNNFLDVVTGRMRQLELAAKIKAGGVYDAYGHLTSDGKQKYQQIMSEISKKYIGKACSMLRMISTNPHNKYSDIMWAVNKEGWVDISLANGDSAYGASFSKLTLEERLNYLDQAKQLFEIEQKGAKNAKDRETYNEAMNGLRAVERVKQGLLSSQKKEKAIKNFLQ